MTVGLGFQGAILGFKTESAWGTKVTPDKFVELVSGKVTKGVEQLHSKAVPKRYVDDGEHAQGAIRVSGNFEMEARYEGLEVLLLHAMGSVSTAEVASFTVTTGTNDKIDFTIGAGALVATVAAGTYIMGATQATAASLCKAIYDAIVAAEGTGTYTVAFSTTTMKMTITRSAGTFTMPWATGANTAISIKALIGYTADDTGGLTYTSDSAVVPVYDHTFTLADDLPEGITFEFDEDISAATIEGGKIDTMDLSIEYNNFLRMAIGVIGEDKTYAAATSATLSSSALVTFAQGAATYGGSSVSVTSAKISLNNNMKKDRQFIGSRLISEPVPNGKRKVTGSLTIEFESVSTQYADFVAATSRAVTLIFTGGAVKATAALTYTITITLPVIKVIASTPNVANEGAIMLDVPFEALATDSSTKEMTIVVRNSIPTVA